MRTRPRASCSRRSPRPQGKAWARRRGRYLRRQGSRGQSPSQAASESKHGAAWSAEKGGQPVFSTRVPFVRLRDLEKRLDRWRMRARGGLGGLGSAPCSGGAAVPPCPLGARRRPPRRGSALAGSRFVSSSLLTPSAGGHAGGSGTLGRAGRCGCPLPPAGASPAWARERARRRCSGAGVGAGVGASERVRHFAGKSWRCAGRVLLGTMHMRSKPGSLRFRPQGRPSYRPLRPGPVGLLVML